MGTQTPAPVLPGLRPGGEVQSQPSLQEPKEQLALPEQAGARRGSESLSDSSEGAVPAHPHGLLPLPLASPAPPPMWAPLSSTMTMTPQLLGRGLQLSFRPPGTWGGTGAKMAFP